MSMHVRASASPLPQSLRGAVIAIGNFDGLHRGHQQLIALARKTATDLGRPCGILTFEPHPRQFFRPDETLFRLTPPDLKLRLAGALGIDFASVLDFNAELASVSPEDFAAREIVAGLGAAHVVTGYDFQFGKARGGNPQKLSEMGERMGFGVSVLEQVRDEAGLEPFSSSAIREHLRQGNVQDAARQLGYWWRIEGVVIKGDQRGRTIGYPTANVELAPGMQAREGIYAARVRIKGRPGVLKGGGYIGKRPTFETDRRFLEIHIIDFAGDLYGTQLEAEFVRFIRPDEKFASLDELLRQMKHDCSAISHALDALAADDPMRAFPLGMVAAEGRI